MRAGVLVLHGFTGTPWEVEPLALALRAAGYLVECPTLPGHCTTPEELARTSWRAWQGAAEAAWARLGRRTERRAVVGFSMGGLLAIRLSAAHEDVGALVTVGTPIALPGWAARAARLLGRFGPRVALPKLRGSDIKDPAAHAASPSYDRIPASALGELLALARAARADLRLVRAPTLVVHATHDHTAPYAHAAQLAAGLGSTDVRMLTLAESFHLAFVDVEADRAIEGVSRFLGHRLAR